MMIKLLRKSDRVHFLDDRRYCQDLFHDTFISRSEKLKINCRSITRCIVRSPAVVSLVTLSDTKLLILHSGLSAIAPVAVHIKMACSEDFSPSSVKD